MRLAQVKTLKIEGKLLHHKQANLLMIEVLSRIQSACRKDSLFQEWTPYDYWVNSTKMYGIRVIRIRFWIMHFPQGWRGSFDEKTFGVKDQPAHDVHIAQVQQIWNDALPQIERLLEGQAYRIFKRRDSMTVKLFYAARGH